MQKRSGFLGHGERERVGEGVGVREREWETRERGGEKERERVWEGERERRRGRMTGNGRKWGRKEGRKWGRGRYGGKGEVSDSGRGCGGEWVWEKNRERGGGEKLRGKVDVWDRVRVRERERERAWECERGDGGSWSMWEWGRERGRAWNRLWPRMYVSCRSCLLFLWWIVAYKWALFPSPCLGMRPPTQHPRKLSQMCLRRRNRFYSSPTPLKSSAFINLLGSKQIHYHRHLLRHGTLLT